MKEKSNLIFFDYIELVLVGLFVVLLGGTTFFVGYRIGLNDHLEAAGFTNEDVQAINMKSAEEEEVAALTQKNTATEEKKEQSSELDEEKKNEFLKRLEKKYSAVAEGEETPNTGNNAPAPMKEKEIASVDQKPVEANTKKPDDIKNQYKGQYTIQMGAMRNLNDAMVFADGIKMVGHKAIINEVPDTDGSTWFKVSIGTFSDRSAANQYVKKEESFFRGQDYVIKKIE